MKKNILVLFTLFTLTFISLVACSDEGESVDGQQKKNLILNMKENKEIGRLKIIL
ncbi:hypothetical protein MUN88_04175 [Gracilibacillus caseinilyticus]|uniref:Lipoprotein n=1 Tax=Gracilibacillus caseinilyticus TaxID=2932256 RepID=A0ABY4EY45_9BACI|nr:hypothetical protein [Gracilibacillus caseinilyticus]UOQ49329.1 hypothetical protein MUN88_04175 [Gracilibacillus caseinilyticus]